MHQASRNSTMMRMTARWMTYGHERWCSARTARSGSKPWRQWRHL